MKLVLTVTEAVNLQILDDVVRKYIPNLEPDKKRHLDRHDPIRASRGTRRKNRQ